MNPYDFVIAIAKTAKYIGVSIVRADYVLDQSLTIFTSDRLDYFSVFQSTLCDVFAKKYGTTMETRFRFNVDIFEKFPIFETYSEALSKIGIRYNDFRLSLFKSVNLGLTKTYNQFHNKELIQDIEHLSSKEFQNKYGKETWNLYNHLEVKQAGNISYEEAVPLITKLRELHKEMDEAVLEAYGWHTDTERWGKAINLRHDFYEVDYLPENDRVRYTIHPEARKEVLKRLLLLNHEMHEAEERNITYEELDAEKTLEIYKGHIKDWLPANNSLHAKTLKFLSSAQELLPTLGSSTAQSYKPFVNQYCSALENELQQKIFVAFNEHFQSQWIGKVEERTAI